MRDSVEMTPQLQYKDPMYVNLDFTHTYGSQLFPSLHSLPFLYLFSLFISSPLLSPPLPSLYILSLAFTFTSSPLLSPPLSSLPFSFLYLYSLAFTSSPLISPTLPSLYFLPPFSTPLPFLDLPPLPFIDVLFPPLPSLPQEVQFPDEVHIDHVSCGSAHSTAWSCVKRKAVCKLPEKVPMEFNHLQPIPIPVLRNRLIVLHHLSNLFCRSLNLFGLQSRHSEAASGGHEGVFEGFDGLRSILLSSAKVWHKHHIASLLLDL